MYLVYAMSLCHPYHVDIGLHIQIDIQLDIQLALSV